MLPEEIPLMGVISYKIHGVFGEQQGQDKFHWDLNCTMAAPVAEWTEVQASAVPHTVAYASLRKRTISCCTVVK